MPDNESARSVDAETDLQLSNLEDDRSVILLIDRQLTIKWCNAAWDRFADANGGPHLVRASIVGGPLLDSISGNLKTYYRRAFEHILRTGIAWRHEYNCSSPAHERKHLLTAYPVADGLVLVNSLQCETRLPMEPARLVARYTTDEGLVVMCGNCRRTRRIGNQNLWDWVPEFLSSPPAQVSHGLCPPCYEIYLVDWATDLEGFTD